MKYLIFTFFLIRCIQGVSQDFDRLKLIQYTSDVDYRVFEKDILESADYILRVPVSGDSNRDIAVQALVRWMRGTPDYVFELNRTIMAIAKNNNDILDVYMAAMTKFILENKSFADEPDEVTYHSFIIFLNYCANPGNKVPLSRKYRKQLTQKIKTG